MTKVIINQILFIFLLLTSTIVNTLNASVYYVEVLNGDDNNTGSEVQPWQSIEKATFELIAGDTVFVKEGVYEVTGTNTRFIPALNPLNSGTIDKPIVFKTYCTDIVTINQKDFGGPLIGSYQQDYIIWDGFIINESETYEGFPNTERNICVLWSSIGCVIQNCEIIGKLSTQEIVDNHVGIRIEDSLDPTIRNCIIHGVENLNGVYHGYGIENFSTSNSPENLIIENCEIYNCGVGIGNHEGGVNNIYRYNYIHDCSGRGFGFGTQNGSSTMGSKIYQNIIANIGDQSIILTPPEDTKMYGFQIFNNTIVTSTGFDTGEITTSFTPQVMIWNNIIVQKGSNPRIFTERHVTESNIDYLDYNMYDIDGQFVLGLYSSSPSIFNNLEEWSLNTGHDLNSLIADPLFINPLDNDFKLSADSPCIGTGVDRQDYNNNGDTIESINMGAYVENDNIIGVYDRFNSNCSTVNTGSVENDLNFKVYPNPTEGLLNITGLDISQVKVFNMYGKKCLDLDLTTSEEIDMKELPQGIYHIYIHTKQKIITRIILKL